ncbi:MAG: AAA family ATPase [Phaeodactylibacter sp.]|nr:AAA family ATPase [Phaeodactylibacter sp.]
MAGAPNPLLALVTGLPGAGKTTFARALAERIGARHINTDIIRSALGLRGRYDEHSKQKVYREMEKQTEEALRSGERAVVDGTFYREALRAPYRQLGARAGAPVYWILIEAPEGVIQERVSKKRDYSEADYAVYLKIRDAWEPLEMPHFILQSGDIGQMLEKALRYLPVQNDGP